MVASGDEFVWLCVRAEYGAMPADGLYDGDALDDLSEHIGRAGSRLDRIDPGRLDREQVYNELRAHVRAAVQVGGSGQAADGGWTWQGVTLDPAANRLADQALAVRRTAEGRDTEGNYAKTGITPVMRHVEAELQHGTLVPDTERFALKSPDRFKEKLAKLIARYPDQTARDLASAIPDGIRYTFLFPSEHYATGVAETTQRLTDRGYRGVNCRWSSGVVPFEVQFHTPESWDAKQRTHDIYEKLSDVRTDPRERGRLEREQRAIAESVTYFAVTLQGKPAGVARRRCGADWSIEDEMLRHDMTWQRDSLITESKRGDATEELAEISEGEADALIEKFREQWCR
jgi:hypothetical protein